jgi:y4mF family transcriptional regulator
MRIQSPKDLAAYVRERRRALDLTQAQLAIRARVSRRWLSDLESGKETIDIGLVLRTLGALGVILDAVPVEQTTQISLDEVLARYGTETP